MSPFFSMHPVSSLPRLAALLAALPSCSPRDNAPHPAPAPSALTSTPAAEPVPLPPVTAPSIATPKVDLATDLAARLQAAHDRFGADIRTHVTGDTFLLVEPGAHTAHFTQAAVLLDRAFPPLTGHFGRPPDAAVTVLLFTNASAYKDYVTTKYGPEAIGDYGRYWPAAREIVADVSGGANYVPTLTHEMVHPLLDADFPKAPLWFAEAIASVFEAPVFAADGGLHGETRNWRQARLDRAFASKTERSQARLDVLFGLSTRAFKGLSPASDAPDHDARLLHYAMARSFAVWLDRQGKLWPFYEDFRDSVGDDRLGTKAFERVMGGSPAALNDAWVTWAR